MANRLHSEIVSSQMKSLINPHPVRRSLGEDGSLEVVTAKCEPSLKDAKPELRYQFERLGYFALDSDSGNLASQAEAPSSGRRLVFNRTITLKDTWAKIGKKG
jgi:hypothetical protein